MPVDPIKPTLNAPGSERLKSKFENPLSNFAFEFNLRRYIQVTEWLDSNLLAAGSHTRPLLAQPEPLL